MNASEFLEYLRIQRVTVQLVNGQLKVKAKPGVLTDWERAQLARLKPEIIAVLSGAATSTAPVAPAQSSQPVRVFYPADHLNEWDAIAHTVAHANTAPYLAPADRARLLKNAAAKIKSLEPATLAKGDSY